VVFANEIGRICLQLGLDPKVIHQIFVADTKLNISPYYLRPGNAFGGSCLPKDVRALVQISAEAGLSNDILKALIPSNENHKQFLFEMATGGMAKGSKILMLGLAFKANSDDLRESPSIDLAKRLLAAGFQLEIHAPTINPKMLLGQNLGYTYTNLPNIAELLISSSELESNDYDLVIDTISSASAHKLKAKRILDFNTLSLADQVA
jgi:GDP-mannose 6-dehydrogenase